MIIPYPEIENKYYYSGTIIDTLWISQKKILFTLGLVIILIPGILTKEKFLHLILNNKITNMLANLTYCIYMIHCLVITYTSCNKH